MPSSQDKQRSLVLKIYDLSQYSALKWELDEFEDPFVVVGSRTIFLESVSDEADVPVEIVKIIDSSGKILERFTDEDIAGEVPPRGGESYYTLMKTIRMLAVRQASGVDKHIDELLSDLDDIIPF